jgi:hypothetical protein
MADPIDAVGRHATMHALRKAGEFDPLDGVVLRKTNIGMAMAAAWFPPAFCRTLTRFAGYAATARR